MTPRFVILNEVKDLTTDSTAREILRYAANDTPRFVILNAVKDLTPQSTAREILRSAQDDGINEPCHFTLHASVRGLMWVSG